MILNMEDKRGLFCGLDALFRLYGLKGVERERILYDYMKSRKSKINIEYKKRTHLVSSTMKNAVFFYEVI